MAVEPVRILAEIPLPLAPAAGQLDAVAVAIAIEDGCGVTLPDEVIDVGHLGQRKSIELLLENLPRSH